MSVPYLIAKGPRVARQLDREELLAYLAEKAWRALWAADEQHPRQPGYAAIERAWKEADEALWAHCGPQGYHAAVAWAEQHFNEIVEPQRTTLSEAIRVRAGASS